MTSNGNSDDGAMALGSLSHGAEPVGSNSGSGSSNKLALSTSSSSSSGRRSFSGSKKGSLRVTVLSAYDLPVRDPPLSVSVKVGSHRAKTGPPVQRHKDRNSFKFGNETSHENELEIVAPLPQLYASSAIIEVAYDAGQLAAEKRLFATYDLNRLRVNETTWLVLHLDEGIRVGSAPNGGDNGPGNGSGKDDSMDAPVTPTLRLQMTLSGPYRTEIAAAVQLAETWFGLVESAERASQSAVDKIPSVNVDPKWMIVPAVPVAAIAVVSAPVVVGIMTIGLPVFLPIMVIAGLVGTAVAAGILATYCSTTTGRKQVGAFLGPVAHTVLSTTSGQKFVYQTGPRPSPVVRAYCCVEGRTCVSSNATSFEC